MVKVKKTWTRMAIAVICFMVAFAMMPITAGAAAKTANIYVSIADQGSFAKAKNGKRVAYIKIKVKDLDKSGDFDIDETLKAAHEKMYEGGADAGYLSEEKEYGLSITKLWGHSEADVNGAFGYRVNDRIANALTDKVKDGSHLYAYIYKDQVKFSDVYSFFNKKNITVTAFKKMKFKLRTYVGWSDEVAALAGAVVTLNGKKMPKAVTDKNGIVDGYFTKAGTYTASAVSSDLILLPPVCTVKVNPMKAAIKKLTVGKKKLTVRAAKTAKKYGAENFRIYYKVKGTSKWKKISSKTQKTVLKNLKRGKRYVVKIQAFSKVNGKIYYGNRSKAKISKKVK